MPLEFRQERLGHPGKARDCTGVYLDQRRVGEILNLGSVAVFKSGGGSRSFPSNSAARRWAQDAYKAAQQAPKPTTRPTASSAHPGVSQLHPRPRDTRKAFPTDAQEIERTIFDLMKRAGSLDVTPPGTNLPPMTLDEVLFAGVDALLGRDPRNAGTVLQSKRMILNMAIRAMGQYLPPAFDQVEHNNPVLQPARVIVVKERIEPPAIVQAVMRALKKKGEAIGPPAPPVEQPALLAPPDDHDDDHDDNQADEQESRSVILSREGVADLFEAAEDREEAARRPAPPAPAQEIALIQTAEPTPKSKPIARGTTGRRKKFNEAQAKEIRAKFWQGAAVKALIEEYGASAATINKVLANTYICRTDD